MRQIFLNSKLLGVILVILNFPYLNKVQAEEKYLHFEKGEKLLREGNYTSAEEEFQKEIALFPNDYLLLLQIAKLYYDHSQYNMSAKYILKAIELEPQNTKIYSYLNKLAFEMSEKYPNEAIESLKEAIKKCPIPEISADLYRRMGSVYMMQERYNEAIETYKIILDKYKDLDEECARAQNSIAFAYYESGQLEQAIESFYATLDRYKTMMPQCVEALTYLGCIYFEKGDSKKPMELWGKGAELNKKSPQPRKSIEYLTNKIGLNEFLQDIRSMPVVWKNDAFFLIGISFEIMGELTKAKEYYEKSLQTREITKDFPYWAVKRRLEKLEGTKK